MSETESSVEESYQEGDSLASTHESADASSSDEALNVIRAADQHLSSSSQSRPSEIDDLDSVLTSDLTSHFECLVGAKRMDRLTLLRICRQRELYETPSLNDVLYLQHQNFSMIENLSPYCNIVTLFLNNNGIKSIRGLEDLTRLRMLYLNFNGLERIEGLSTNTSLEYLNVCNNKITSIKNISHLKKLETLLIANNSISNLPTDITDFPSSLNTLDVSNNLIATLTDEQAQPSEHLIIEYLSKLQLTQLYCQGNPFIADMKQSRRKLVAHLKTLRYLDKSTVTDSDRDCAVAWMEGGREAEVKVRIEQENSKRNDMDKLVSDFRKFQLEGSEALRENSQMQCEDDLSKSNSVIVDEMRKALSQWNPQIFDCTPP